MARDDGGAPDGAADDGVTDDGLTDDGVRIERVPWDDPDAQRLCTAQQAELRVRYGDDDAGHEMTGAGVVATVLLRLDGAPVACGALRDARADLGAGAGELKRMYVVPAVRGRGLSRRVLATLEAAGREHGFARLALETGVLQPEAIGLYLGTGYRPIENYGQYVGVVESRCFAKALATGGPARRGSAPAAAPGPVVVEQVGWDHPEASALRHAMVREMTDLYPEHGDAGPVGVRRFDDAQGDTVLATYLLRLDGDPVGCATLRSAAEWGPDVGELKRVYVAPAARGRGIARVLVGHVEDDARARGLTRVVLDTGIRQRGALELYLSLGYRAVAPEGDWAALPLSLWFARTL